MSKIQFFCDENQLSSEEDIARFVDGCQLILGFIHEFELSYSEDDLRYIKKLHDGTSPDLEYWREKDFNYDWIGNLQSINVFPTYDILMEFKQKVEKVIVHWIKDR